MNTVVKIEDVSVIIRKHVILEHINLEMEPGKIYGFVGRNGSGKTVMMKCICGFMPATSGEITVNGKRIGKDCDFPPDTGVIIETPEFLPYLSGYQNLKTLANMKQKIHKPEIEATMDLVGLDPKLKRQVRKYSLGMRQRLGLAQAIMENPSLLVLDEPMNGLDKHGVADMRRYLLQLKEQGKTIIIASHSTEDISVLCDETYEFEDCCIHKL